MNNATGSVPGTQWHPGKGPYHINLLYKGKNAQILQKRLSWCHHSADALLSCLTTFRVFSDTVLLFTGLGGTRVHWFSQGLGHHLKRQYNYTCYEILKDKIKQCGRKFLSLAWQRNSWKKASDIFKDVQVWPKPIYFTWIHRANSWPWVPS